MKNWFGRKSGKTKKHPLEGQDRKGSCGHCGHPHKTSQCPNK